ncbi:MAG: hypothetical protein KGI57_03970, partial [Hyphomicrobiales bacterium]|nr:hypothetical protein [Hyphomicrobiales bacterium]
FVYGLVHAAAPGHGKTLLAAYAVAGRKTLRQAATLAAVAAAAQAAGAIALVGAADALLHLTSATMTRTAFAFQVGSSLVVAALGLWLLAGKLLPAAIPRAADCEPAGASRFAATPGPRGGLGGLWDRLRYGAGEAAERCACGAIHAALPELAAGSLDLRKAASAVLAVALRPCTGALIALAFAMSLHAFWIGAAAAVAMGAGVATALVGLLALTLGARGAAGLARRKPGPWARGAARTLEIAAAAAMVLFGLVGALAGLHAALT